MPPRGAVGKRKLPIRRCRRASDLLIYLDRVEWIIVDRNGVELPPVATDTLADPDGSTPLPQDTDLTSEMIMLHRMRHLAGGHAESAYAMSLADGELINTNSENWQQVPKHIVNKTLGHGRPQVSPIKFGLSGHIPVSDRNIKGEPGDDDVEMADGDGTEHPFFSQTASASTNMNPAMYPLDFKTDRPAAQDLLPMWSDACQFFWHDPVDLRGVLLPGFSCCLPQPTMLAIYCWLSAKCHQNQGDCSVELTVPESMATAGILALAWASIDACPGQEHSDFNGSTTIEQLYGLNCTCRVLALTSAINKATIRGPCAIVARDAAQVRGLADLAKALFTTLEGLPLVSPASFSGCTYFPPTDESGHYRPSMPSVASSISIRHSAAPSPSFVMTLAQAQAHFKCTPLSHPATDDGFCVNKERLVLLINLDGLDVQAFDLQFGMTVHPPKGKQGKGKVQMEPGDTTIITRLFQPMFIFSTEPLIGLDKPVHGLLSDLCRSSGARPRILSSIRL